MQGPAPVVDEDGLENILVHVIGINGEWLWSSVVPEHLRMDELQRMFQMSDRTRFGLVDGHWYKLVYDCKWVGPYPEAHVRSMEWPGPRGRPHHSLRMDVGSVDGLVRAIDTREVWITAIKVLVI